MDELMRSGWDLDDSDLTGHVNNYIDLRQDGTGTGNQWHRAVIVEIGQVLVQSFDFSPSNPRHPICQPSQKSLSCA